MRRFSEDRKSCHVHCASPASSPVGWKSEFQSQAGSQEASRNMAGGDGYWPTEMSWPHGLQHARFFCPPLSPRVCLNSCPLSLWYYLPHLLLPPSPFAFSLSKPQGLFHWTSCLHQVAKVSASVLPMNIQCWFPLGRTGLISLLSKGLSRVFSRTPFWKHQFFGAQPSLWSDSQFHMWL